MHKIILGALALSLALIFAAPGSFHLAPADLPETGVSAAAVILHDLPADDVNTATFLDLDKILGDVVYDSKIEATTTPEDSEIEDMDTDSSDIISIDPGSAAVKIRCVQTTNTYKRTASGTGFLINSHGVIMTNAHVAQFLLLKDSAAVGETECEATVGTNDEDSFSLGLLYISPSWLLKHASLIASTTPKGTGENDFALVYITKKLGGTDVDNIFPFLPPATSPLSKTNKDKVVTIVGYPRQPNKTAPQLIATTTITGIYTFGSGYADIISLDSSPLGHQGASGGPVIDELGRAIGIITTKDAGTTVLNAITMAHVDRGLKSEIGFDLASYLQGNLNYKAELFNKTVSPILQEILAGYLTE